VTGFVKVDARVLQSHGSAPHRSPTVYFYTLPAVREETYLCDATKTILIIEIIPPGKREPVPYLIL
jgi:hypothetical protein